MKKLVLFLQLAAFILFASCSDEDPDPAPQPPVIETNTIFVYMPWSGPTKQDLAFIASSSPIYKT